MQGSNPGLPHCRRVLYHLSYRGSPKILEWVAYTFSRVSQPRNRTRVSCIADRFFTSWATREFLAYLYPFLYIVPSFCEKIWYNRYYLLFICVTNSFWGLLFSFYFIYSIFAITKAFLLFVLCGCTCMLSRVQLFCDPMDCSLPGSVHESSQPRGRTPVSCISCIGRKILCHWAFVFSRVVYIYIYIYIYQPPGFLS